MITYLFQKEMFYDDDFPFIVFILLLPICIILDIAFIPFQYLFYRLYLKRKSRD